MQQRVIAMKILAMFAALVASATLASAAPKLGTAQPTHSQLAPKKAEGTGRVMLGPRKPTPPPKRPALVEGWAELADPTPTRFGTVFVSVAASAGPMAKIRIDAVKGTVAIQRIKVHFTDGTTAVFALRKSLIARRQGSALIDFGTAKVIDQIDVTTGRKPLGEYTIHGTAKPTPASSSCC